uniref:Uncharacterized protein n=1 Tax=Arundo donax TaxID=35708 RepID=A0A0A9A7C0_ARUDO
MDSVEHNLVKLLLFVMAKSHYRESMLILDYVKSSSSYTKSPSERQPSA